MTAMAHLSYIRRHHGRRAVTVKGVPNALTVTRMLVTPALIVCLFQDTLFWQAAALLLFVIAAVSDFLDGHFARQLKAQSRLGRFLDPAADKILVLSTFVALAVLYPALVPWWAVFLIAARDFVVTGLRMRADARGRSLVTLPVAKAKTAVQITFLMGLLLLLTMRRLPGAASEVAEAVLQSAGPFAVLIVVVVFTVSTGLWYLVKPESIPADRQ